MRQVRLGVIGCGVIGRIHMRFCEQAEHIDLAAVADVRREAAEEAAEAHHVGKVFADGQALLDDPDIDAVVLAMPTHLRGALALGAFARGKHVLTEKPPALDGDELRGLIAARGDLVGACCSSRHRFLPSAQEATRIIASGELGPLRVLRARGVTSAGALPKNPPPAWRVSHKLNGGGITVNWGVYDLDYLLGLIGWSVTPRLALAQAFPVAPHLAGRVADGSDAETHLVGLVTTEEGCAISFERAEFAATQPDHAWEIIGERGSLVLRLLPGAGNELIQFTTTADEGVHREVVWQGDETFDMVHAGPVVDFARAILDGTEPLTSLERALVVQATIDAMYASAASGEAQPVRI